jgi:hypothetical protein
VITKKVFDKLEREVSANAGLLDKKEKALSKSHKGQVCVFNKGTTDFYKSFDEAMKSGIAKHGSETGFVVREIGAPVPFFGWVGRR